MGNHHDMGDDGGYDDDGDDGMVGNDLMMPSDSQPMGVQGSISDEIFGSGQTDASGTFGGLTLIDAPQKVAKIDIDFAKAAKKVGLG